MLKKVPIAVLCSGGGTNLQAILDSAAAGAIPSGEVVLVVSDNASAYALERAAKAGVETAVFDRKAVPSRAEREEKILSVLQEKQIGLVILAGFMTILSEKFTRAFENRIINVHPSLIPSFCGPGYYGLKVHEAALARGVLPLIFPVLLLVLVCSRVAVPALLWILLILSLAGLLCLTGPLTMGSCAMSLAALRGGVGAAHFSPVLPQ